MELELGTFFDICARFLTLTVTKKHE